MFDKRLSVSNLFRVIIVGIALACSYRLDERNFKPGLEMDADGDLGLNVDHQQLEPVWRKGTHNAFGKLPGTPEDNTLYNYVDQPLNVDQRQPEPVWIKGTDSAFGKLPGPIEEDFNLEVIRQNRLNSVSDDESDEEEIM